MITAVGLGDRGFVCLEMQLLGPSISLLGLIMSGFRALMCLIKRGSSQQDNLQDDEI